MKKINVKAISLILSIAFVVGCLPGIAANADSYKDSGVTIVDSDGTQIEMAGQVKQTILSVTMPSYIPFEVSKNISSENKAVSPKIEITNNSEVPIKVYVSNVDCDFSQLPYCCLRDDPRFMSQYDMCIGFEMAENEPTSTRNGCWMRKGEQNTMLATINPKDTQPMYVVAVVGSDVPDGRSFTMIPTIVVSATE